ncbi:MAG: iron(III) transport system permease protein [Abditibacteriota bacterium]|nr:iron(III) transport system permease protein [Abditibacteriota bacterium]
MAVSSTSPAPFSPRRAWPVVSLTTWVLSLLVFGPFLIYPVGKLFWGALVQDGQFTPSLLLLPFQDPDVWQSVRNSFGIGVATVVFSSLIAFPLAYTTARMRFWGKTLLTGLLLVPLLLPPLVGAVGLKQMLGREGVINTLLLQMKVLSAPIDWLQMEAPMVVAVGALHLYPLIYLNLSAAWANIDPTLEEAAENQGATGWMIFRTVTLPLLMPGYFSGALIVFIAAFTDLGTPLVFGLDEVAAVQIFNARTDTSRPDGYVLAFWLTLLAGVIFWISRRYLESNRIATVSRATGGGREIQARGIWLVLIYALFGSVIGLALLPHIGVILASLARDWTATLWPDWTTENFARLANPETSDARLAANSIKVSLICAAASMSFDVIAGFALAYALVRGKVWGRGVIDTVAMLPLALPGLILAFGLLVSFSDTPLDPVTFSPIPLLIISYAIRRLPYALRAVSSGLQQMSVTLEEASANLGATPMYTVWHVTRPLIGANLIAAGLLTFAFAVLEVSDSLILSTNNDTAPIAKAIFALSLQISGGTFLACALGVIGMVLLTFTFLLANRLLGRQLGALFRV